MPASSSTSTRKKGGGGIGCVPRRRYKNPELTEESLEEFNQRNEKRTSLSGSPYYDDSSPYITRQKVARASSPGRESHVTSSSSISTVLIKIHQWSTSCFRGKKKGESVKGKAVQDEKKHELFSSIDTVAINEAMELRRRNSISAKVVSSSTGNNEEKPLRERVLIAPIVVRSPVEGENKAELIEERKMIAKNEERVFVWANKYRPKALKDFICNRDKAEQLISMVPEGECSHYIFEGPHGVGKRTMVWALLREAYGAEKLTTRQEVKEFTLKGEALPSIKVNMQISSKHVEINTSELAGYEKHIMVELIMQKDNITDQEMQSDHFNCHAIILHEADKLSTDAQLYIRWIVERNKGCKRIFFCCHDASKLQTIKPLCKVIQLLPPSNKEIIEVLQFVAEQEGIQLPHRLAERITEKAQHNLRQAIRSFESTWQWRSDPLLKEDQVIMTGWEEDITNIAKNIIEEQSPKQLYVIRGKLQSLIEHNVSPDFIFSTLVFELKRLLGDNFRERIDALYQEYNRDSGGILARERSLVLLRDKNEETEGKRKNIHQFLRIEAKFMSWYKSSILNSLVEPNGHGARTVD